MKKLTDQKVEPPDGGRKDKLLKKSKEMQRQEEIEDITQKLEKRLGKPVYKSIGMDAEGSEIAVPVFEIGENEGSKMRKRLRNIMELAEKLERLHGK